MDELDSNPELMSILSDVCIYDNYIFNHSLNVTLYALAVGMELKIKPAQLEMIGLGSMLHDIGKISVPKEILLKPGKLTEEEYEVIKTHTTEGFEMLRNSYSVPFLWPTVLFNIMNAWMGLGIQEEFNQRTFMILPK